MSIRFENGNFILETKNTTYAFTLYDDNYPVHLYYGAKKDCTDLKLERIYKSFSPYMEEHGMNFSFDCAPLEFPTYGYGDFRTTALKVRGARNSVISLVPIGYDIYEGREYPDGLPYAEPSGDCETLRLHMWDEIYALAVDLIYTVYPSEDVITRFFYIENAGRTDVKVERAMSLTLDIRELEDADYVSLRGVYAHERYFQREHLGYGNHSIYSRRGSSSHHHNPFMAILDHSATEDEGAVYGVNLIYSGSFLTEAEKDPNGLIRLQTGLGEEQFGYTLEKGESLDTPEAILTFSDKGLNGMSRNFHRFIRKYLLPKEKFEARPVVLNTWEASYFDIDEDNLLTFAESAKENGLDMLVMDDGWFGKRDNDTSSLGDWYEHKTKFPSGLANFIDRVKAKGVKFGIWIEPEMINPDSELYRAHPDWAMSIPGRSRLLSRHQMVLDMANPQVVDYLIDRFEKTLGPLNIDYIKWDMNRNISPAVSPYLPPEKQDETLFRYMKGVYRLYRWFNERFPSVMIENCSGGGGRYDLGMAKYSTQIWTSDHTDPMERIPIQHGSTYAYPPAMMSCHVSNARELTSDPRHLDFAFRLAVNGPLGYELHLPGMPEEVKATIREQINAYRGWEDTILRGDFYRVHNPQLTPYYSYYFISEDESHILATFIQYKGEEPRDELMCILADESAVYVDELTGKEYSGSELRRGLVIKTDERDYTYYQFSLRRK